MNIDLNLEPPPEEGSRVIRNEEVNLELPPEEGLRVIRNEEVNLEPPPEEGSRVIRNEEVNLDDVVGDPNFGRIMDAFRVHNGQRRRWRQVQFLPETSVVELNQLMVNSGHGSTLQSGECSVATEERVNEDSKICENKKEIFKGDLDKKDNDEKSCGNDENYFDCNICFDFAREPVVTSCGHLFCWPCIYKWLNVHSDDKECPVCKGEVMEKNIFPIYGRGSCVRYAEEDSSLKVPPRPDAKRVESLRETINSNRFSSSMEEMILLHNSGHDSTRDVSSQHVIDVTREATERTNLLLDSILTNHSLSRERFPIQAPTEMFDLIQQDANIGTRQQLGSIFPRRSQTHRGPEGERSYGPYARGHLITRRNRERPPVDNRDSFSSDVAGADSETHIMDTVVEINSRAYLPISSSRRRTYTSRTSNVDNRNSRTPRRRRLS